MEQKSNSYDSNFDLFDIEEQLVRFTVRSNAHKTEVRPTTSRNYKTETEVVPLLVKDIHLLTLPDRSFSETISVYGIPFASMLIYGRVSSTGAGANGKLRYSLDDGTGLVKIRLLKHKNLNFVHKLDLECFRTIGHNKELFNSVQNILKVTRKQLLDVGQLPYGTKVLAIGRPHRLFDEVVFSVFEMIIDNSNNNDLEISAKNFIIEWYTTRYKGKNLKDPI